MGYYDSPGQTGQSREWFQNWKNGPSYIPPGYGGQGGMDQPGFGSVDDGFYGGPRGPDGRPISSGTIYPRGTPFGGIPGQQPYQPSGGSRYQPGGGQMGGRPQGPPMGGQPQKPFLDGGYAPNQPPQRFQQPAGQMGGQPQDPMGGGPRWTGGGGAMQPPPKPSGGGWGANNLGGQGGMQQQMMQNMLLNPNTQQPNRPGFGGGWGGGNR